MDQFGNSVAVSGNHLLVGARLDDVGGISNIGSAYLFDALSGDLLRTFSNPSPEFNNQFGHSVAIDGDRVLVGAV
ncbi:MAG: hypothetical protein AB4426_03740 [Xenococcaceae cyanobacterium]